MRQGSADAELRSWHVDRGDGGNSSRVQRLGGSADALVLMDTSFQGVVIMTRLSPPASVQVKARELRTGRRRYYRPLRAERLEERCVLAAQTTGLFVNTPEASDGY